MKRAFDLDRMVLFSDAIFAIAVTLLVLDIKFPHIEDGGTASLKEFRPMILHFGAFVISFIFIGSMWYRHLQTFRFLRTYDTGLVVRNLFFIFFIVCFPIVVSGLTENASRLLAIPTYIYLANVSLTVFAHFEICRYIFRANPGLCAAGNFMQKKYMFEQSKYTTFAFIITIVLCILSQIIFPGNIMAFVICVYLLPLMLFIIRKKLSKMKAAAREEKVRELKLALL